MLYYDEGPDLDKLKGFEDLANVLYEANIKLEIEIDYNMIRFRGCRKIPELGKTDRFNSSLDWRYLVSPDDVVRHAILDILWKLTR